MTDEGLDRGDGPRLVALILRVSDLESSTRLYRQAFGLDLRPGDNQVDDPWTGGRHTEVSWRAGAPLHFALYPPGAGATTGVQLSLAVADIERAHQQATAGGAVVLHEPRTEPWGRSARYQDLDGNVIELTQPADPGRA